jgi:hypothetical protein
LIFIIFPICVVLLIVSIILAIKWWRSCKFANNNSLELVPKVASIKGVQVLEKIGGGAFGEVYRGLMDVSNAWHFLLVIAISSSCIEDTEISTSTH